MSTPLSVLFIIEAINSISFHGDLSIVLTLIDHRLRFFRGKLSSLLSDSESLVPEESSESSSESSESSLELSELLSVEEESESIVPEDTSLSSPESLSLPSFFDDLSWAKNKYSGTLYNIYGQDIDIELVMQ